MTSNPFGSRTLATFRSAEFGFLGVVVYTRVQTPRFCGDPANAGTLLFVGMLPRPFLTNWLIVGIILTSKKHGRPTWRKWPPDKNERPKILRFFLLFGQADTALFSLPNAGANWPNNGRSDDPAIEIGK